MKHLTRLISLGLARWHVALGLLAMLVFPAPALSAVCSSYFGQASINELSIAVGNTSNVTNQVEIYNSGNVAESVWRTWTLTIYHEGTVKTTAAMSNATEFTAAGQFIYNNNKALFLENNSGRGKHDVEVLLTDASGAYIDYVLLGASPILSLPACLGTAKKATASSSKNTAGNLSRTTDGGTWPSTVTSTSNNTIGRSNNCNASGNDLSVSYAADQLSPVVNTTTVNYTLTVTNRNCSTSVSGIKVTATNISATNFSSLVYSTTTPASTGTRTLVGSNLEWSGITLAGGASASLTITGVPKLLGALSSVASISLPSGLVNTSNDSDTEAITVVGYNYVGFDLTTDTLLEGTDLTYDASISTSVISTKSVTVNYTVSCPLCSSDTNLPASGSLTLPANDGTGLISFTITNDSFYEPDKTIVITITSISSTDSGVKLSPTNNAITLTLQDDDYDTDTSLPTVTAEYRFDEALWAGASGEVKDSSTNARHGTASGLNGTYANTSNSSRAIDGSTGTCAYGVFDRANKQFVSLPASFPDLGSSSFTITGWIRTTNNALSGQRIFWDDATSSSSGYALSLGDAGAGILRFYQRGAGTNINVDTASVITNDTWYFVAAVVDTTTKSRTVYVYDDTGTLLTSPSSAYTAATFGSDSGAAAMGGASNTGTSGQTSSNYGFAGNLDELRVYPAALTPAKLGAVQALTRACATYGPHHYELSMPSTGLACLPNTVTVTACAGATSPCSSAYTSGNGSTASLTATGGSLAASSVTFNAAGVATTTLSYPTATDGASATVTLAGVSAAAGNANQCCPNGTSCTVSSTCSSTFNTAGLIYSSSANGTQLASFPAQVAGTSSGTYYVRAVKTSTTTKACETALTGAATVNWGVVCVNPASCSTGNLMSVTGNGGATAVAGNPNGTATSFTGVSMTFDGNGNAPFSFTYNDAGRIRLDSKMTVNSATLSGLNSTSSHVTKPARFAVGNIKQTASPNLVNPAAADAAGSRFVKAGESFTATVTAQTTLGATTPNFGKESTPEGVLLTPALVLPSGGASGSLSNGTIAGGSFSNGVATVTNLAYSEVGIINLTSTVASGNYINTGGAVAATTTTNIGRFYPAQFALSGGTVTHRSGSSCSPASAFTYLGENFLLGLTLTAQNTTGATTANYSGAFAKLDPTSAASWNVAGLGGTTTFSTISGRLSLGTATGSWANGVASNVALTANASRASAADGPFSAAFGVAPVDSDGVTMSTLNMASTTSGTADRTSVSSVALRFGRLRLANAVGGQSRALSLPLTAQYWTGTAFDTNTLDSCTAIASTHVSFGNLRKTLTTADTSVSGSSFGLSSGLGALKIGAPLGGRYGTVDVTLSLGSSATDASCLQPWTPGTGDVATAGANLSFLRGAWCGSTYVNDPSARASFGLYRGADAMVYQRENY